MSKPDTKYQILWRGEWRPVVHMYDAHNQPTTLVLRAAKAVLWVTDTYWVATYVNPGEITERFDRDPKLRVWEYVDH
jgi:hypothetical protein